MVSVLKTTLGVQPTVAASPISPDAIATVGVNREGNGAVVAEKLSIGITVENLQKQAERFSVDGAAKKSVLLRSFNGTPSEGGSLSEGNNNLEHACPV